MQRLFRIVDQKLHRDRIAKVQVHRDNCDALRKCYPHAVEIEHAANFVTFSINEQFFGNMASLWRTNVYVIKYVQGDAKFGPKDYALFFDESACRKFVEFMKSDVLLQLKAANIALLDADLNEYGSYCNDYTLFTFTKTHAISLEEMLDDPSFFEPKESPELYVVSFNENDQWHEHICINAKLLDRFLDIRNNALDCDLESISISIYYCTAKQGYKLFE